MDLALPPLPFSSVFSPLANAAWMRIPPEFQVPSATYSEPTQLELPAGVVQVIVTWQGTESLYVRHYRGDQSETVAIIPGASSPTMRSTGVLTLASEDVQALRLINSQGSTDSWSTTTLDREYVAGVQVMPVGTPADITGGGSLLRVDNSVGSRVFLGDQMIHGDTGWRRLTDADGFFPHGITVSGFNKIARQGDIVTLILSVKIPDEWTAADEVFEPPVGFRPRAGTYFGPAYASNVSTYFGTSGFQYYGAADRTLRWQYTYRVRSGEPWPTSLPGVPD